jgi:hypothetical protein
MALHFEWADSKALLSFRKHRVAFEEAATVFGDPLSLTIEDPLHSDREDRYVTVGLSFRRRLLVVAHTHQGRVLRPISAREATARERAAYEEGTVG